MSRIPKWLPHRHQWTPSYDSKLKPYYWCYWCSKHVPPTYKDENGHQRIMFPNVFGKRFWHRMKRQ